MVDLGEDEERFEQFMRPLEGGFFLKLFIYFRPIAKKVITTYIIHSWPLITDGIHLSFLWSLRGEKTDLSLYAER